MKSRSLLGRLFIRLALATAATVLIALGLLIWQFERATGNPAGTDLKDMLDAVIQHVRVDASGKPSVALPADFPFALGEHRFVVISDQEGRAYQSLPAGHEHVYHPFSHEQTTKPQFFEHRYVESPTTYLGVTQHVVRDDVEFWIQVVDEVSYFETLAYNSLMFFGEGLGVLIVLHLCIVMLLCYQAVRSAIGPIRHAADEAQQIGPGSRDKRITLENLPKEVRPLAEAANQALDRLQHALVDQRQFTADAAHEILTPLAVIRAEAESLGDPERAKAMLTEIDDLSEMASQLLEIAEIDGMEILPEDPVDLRMIAETVIARFAGQLIDHGIEPRLIAPPDPVVVPGCPKGIRSALSNIVKNVIQHADGGRNLEVRIEQPGRIIIADDGRGIPAADRRDVFRRFRRSGPSQPGNSGLGLAIVKRVVDRHGGSIALTDGLDGAGIALTLEFPVTRPTSVTTGE